MSKTHTRPRKITRMQREAAAASAETVDLAPLARAAVVVLGVLLLVTAADRFVPDGGSFGGPLQDPRIASTATMSTVRSGGRGVVSVGFFVPWNDATQDAVLDKVIPLEVDGLEVVKAGLVPPGSDAIVAQRGFPPGGVALGRVGGTALPPGDGPLDEYQVVVGLRGTGSVLGFLVRYHVGSTDHEAIVTHGLLVCANGCPEDEIASDQRAWAASLAPFVLGPART